MAMDEKKFTEFRQKAFQFLWVEVAPLEEEIERTGKLPREALWPKFRDTGQLGLLVPIIFLT